MNIEIGDFRWISWEDQLKGVNRCKVSGIRRLDTISSPYFEAFNRTDGIVLVYLEYESDGIPYEVSRLSNETWSDEEFCQLRGKFLAKKIGI